MLSSSDAARWIWLGGIPDTGSILLLLGVQILHGAGTIRVTWRFCRFATAGCPPSCPGLLFNLLLAIIGIALLDCGAEGLIRVPARLREGFGRCPKR